MSTAPKHKKRKIGSTTGQRGEGSATNEAHPGKVESGPKTEFRFSSEIDHAIWCAVLGKPSPWLIDLEFERVGSFEDRFRAGDKQILLWELFDCWRDNRPIPQWAGEALFKLLFDMAKGLLRTAKDRLPSWDDAFGRQYAVDKQSRGMQTRSVMFDVYLQYEHEKKKNQTKPRVQRIDTAGLLQKAGEPFGINGDVAKKLIKEVKDAIERGYRPITFDLHQR
jgi:hypothetical protein